MAADSIKLFQFLEKYCQTFRVYPLQPNQKRYHINSLNWIIILCLNQFFISLATFFFFEATSMFEYGLTFFVCLCILSSDIHCFSAFGQAKDISNFVENWEKFIGKRVYSTIDYKKENDRIERLSKWFAVFLLQPCMNFLMPMLNTMVNYYISDLGVDSFFLALPAWYPFDWKTPFGYFLAWLSQFTGFSSMLIIATPFDTFMLASCLLFMFTVEDITKDLNAFKCFLRTSDDVNRNRGELMERLSNAIQLYSDAKQCMNEFNDICELPLFGSLVYGILSITCSLTTLQFELWDDNSNPKELYLIVSMVVWIFIMTYFILEIGEQVTHRFELFGEELEECDWNKLPIRLQRMYLIFLSDIQHPIHIQSFAGIKSSRDTFKKIANTGFSYFTTLRQLKI